MLAFGLLAMLAFAGQQTVVQPVVVHSADAVRCKDGVVAAPTGPFAVWVFCDDALGTQIGVVYARNMGAPNDGAWGLNNRFWQEGAWTSEVQTFAWSTDGTSLFVSTGAVYGSSGLFQLDLHNRKARELITAVPDHDVRILSVTSKTIRYRLRNVETEATRDGEVPIRGVRGN